MSLLINLSRKSAAAVQGEHGLTLTEMIIVLGIVSMLTLVVLPFFGVTDQNVRLDQFYQQLEADLYQAQQLALNQSSVVELEFNPGLRFYRVQYRYGEVVTRRSFPDGVSLSTNFDRNRFHFNRHGHISQAGSLLFVHHNGRDQYMRAYIFQLGSGRFRVEVK